MELIRVSSRLRLSASSTKPLSLAFMRLNSARDFLVSLRSRATHTLPVLFPSSSRQQPDGQAKGGDGPVLFLHVDFIPPDKTIPAQLAQHLVQGGFIGV